MNTNYLYEYIDLLERVLSTAYKYSYSTGALEKNISESPFFQTLESNDYQNPIIDEETLIKEVFPEIEVDLDSAPIYNQCLWAAESYLRIQDETKFTFELIFLYIPIKEMYRCFDLYHEMDFSQIIDEFKRRYEEKSVFAILLDKYKFSLKDINIVTGISYETLASLKQRKRNIKKVNVETIIKIARFFRVRIETISEVSLY